MTFVDAISFLPDTSRGRINSNELRDLVDNSGYREMTRYLDAQWSRIVASYEFLRQTLPANPGRVLLDLGSGGGVFLPVVHAIHPFSDIHCIDGYDPGPMKWRAPSSCRVRQSVMDIQGAPLPVQDHTVDLVIFGEILEHLEHDPMQVLLEINRVLKPGGLLFLSTPNVIGGHAFRRMLLGDHPGVSPAFWPKAQSQDAHRREYTPDEVCRLLMCAGMQLLSRTTAPPPSRKMALLIPLLRRIMRLDPRNHELGETLFVLARQTRHIVPADMPAADRYPAPVYLHRTF